MNKLAIVNIYNFVRKSHEEPSKFIIDDFETLENQLTVLAKFNLPSTVALKYDALMDEEYQKLIKTYKKENELAISAWWEITAELCERAGVQFRGERGEEYDDRVDSAYSIAYEPEERIKIVDAYMQDFKEIYGVYPQSIGSWVLDECTLEYAKEQYGIVAAAVCRDQIATDGFTLWGGYPNGPYYPSVNNLNVPAQSEQKQLKLPIFRLLGPDPIFMFEQNVRDTIFGVHTLEPSSISGRGERIPWTFARITDEDAVGINYLQVGQENNFLWPNIAPGYIPQIETVNKLRAEGKLLVQTMAETANFFSESFELTPPMSYQGTTDWSADRLEALNYASSEYRLSFLYEKQKLRIRDFFKFEENYKSRYLDESIKTAASFYDCPPLLFPQIWKQEYGKRPFIKLLDAEGLELDDIEEISFSAIDAYSSEINAQNKDGEISIKMFPDRVEFSGRFGLLFEYLPVLKSVEGKKIYLEYESFPYELDLAKGEFEKLSADSVKINSEEDQIIIKFSDLSKAEICEKDLSDVYGKLYEKNMAIISDSARVENSSNPDKESAYQKVIQDLESAIEFPEKNSEYRLKNMTLSTDAVLDKRDMFNQDGPAALLSDKRGSLDFIDGNWIGTLDNFNVKAELDRPEKISSIKIGFLYNHRQGIICPKEVKLLVKKAGESDFEVLESKDLSEYRAEREIEKLDLTFDLGKGLEIDAFEIQCESYEKMPDWTFYRGSTGVFTVVDNLIVMKV
ncbi:hypothetical protein [Fastidiosipila sanguinis]|uniref:Uncharacterized protein n=1 Tax=Fastidiosipila sanguinis TaxID=236753 RepID=A0A2S0KP59_9FIRM|nr:hypothetical protein [Fastidiosipila sanguinis]AVM42797.1 hypothetical protein C5Q98_06040 [Fastidiosipila sanguinis]